MHWSETREHPDRERLNVTRQRGGKEEKQMPEGGDFKKKIKKRKKKEKKKKKGKMQLVSYKNPIRGIRALKWRTTMNNL